MYGHQVAAAFVSVSIVRGRKTGAIEERKGERKEAVRAERSVVGTYRSSYVVSLKDALVVGHGAV